MKKFIPILLSFSFSIQAIEGGKSANEKQMLTSGTITTFIERNQKYINHCTGVRISKKVILTAAHCVSNPEKFPVGVKQGLNPRDENIEMEKVVGMAFPLNDYFLRQFQGERNPDIALLLLEKESFAPFSKIAVPDLGETVLQFGYGMTGPQQFWEAYPLAFLDNALIKSSDGNLLEVSASHGGLRGGDSGGPVLNKKFELLGIASMGGIGYGDSITGEALYTSPLPYLNWIRKVTQDSDIQAHLKDLPTQYTENTAELYSKEEYINALTKECIKMKTISNTEWELRGRNCFPKDRATCEKLPRGLITELSTMDVVWNTYTAMCVWSDEI